MRDWREENKNVRSVYEECRCNHCGVGTYYYAGGRNRELNILTCSYCGTMIDGNLPKK